jgi:hypothetical protein
VAAIAELTSPLSPRSLDLVYFGKKLADLTPADFQKIGEISRRCPPGEQILKADKLELLRQVIAEAQLSRELSITWGKERIVEVQAMPMDRQRLTRLNNLWIELEAREGQMMRDDVDSFASWIAREQQTMYDAAPRWRPNRPAIASVPLAPPPGQVQASGRVMAAGDTPILSFTHPRRPGGEED